MSTVYDPRRPRLPIDLAARVDEARGQVPYNRWIVAALESALDGESSGPPPVSQEVWQSPRLERQFYEKPPKTPRTSPQERASGKPSWVQPIPKGKR